MVVDNVRMLRAKSSPPGDGLTNRGYDAYSSMSICSIMSGMEMQVDGETDDVAAGGSLLFVVCQNLTDRLSNVSVYHDTRVLSQQCSRIN